MTQNIDFKKYADGLVPAIVQDSRTGRVLMLGFTNDESLKATRTSGRVTFYSRAKQRLWTKGETSGNYLAVDSIVTDCDSDTILIKGTPSGPVCHTGVDTCFGETNDNIGFLFELERTIADRQSNPTEGSYTASLFAEGMDRIAQKVGEEAVELVIASKNNDKKRIRSEAADLIFHLLVLLRANNVSLDDVIQTLTERGR